MGTWESAFLYVSSGLWDLAYLFSGSLTLCIEGTEENCGLKAGIPESSSQDSGVFLLLVLQVSVWEEKDILGTR